ncbi:23S rRNA pseudouridine synthase F [Photobacterium jeanii]|uniref:Pseudouridine synthase n=1 Tax=Photobacterium jeanii TaxID=858640 RepID=A0A178K884_9GAMM|nr:23S rRNA pseudouridine(2604) synthase RluF [Photobacterium jeanii]OAN13521.1 23S rRNA pseudouridine synthase F [Photobacterium jeanii]PST88636.1 23S rRNA pseudouridine(2604) synthase RluF [Photobacterium jeanii]
MSQNKTSQNQTPNTQSQNEVKAVRLNKFISDTGYCSRREADKLIDQGRVTINGKEPEMGMKVMPQDEVLVDGRPLRAKEAPIYIALNKPTGITCTTERHIKDNIVDFIGHRKRIFPIGRLDKFSDGLIFMTNDGDIVNKILRAGNNHEKEYVVRVNRIITDEFISKMSSGVEILDTVTLPCKVTKETDYTFRIVLTQGLNRQIRRMVEALGYEVYKLRRVRIMNVTIDGLPNGKWRYLTDAEMAEINAMIADSSSTEEASRTDGEGKQIAKPTDAKLFDSRQQAKQTKQEGERSNFKTYKGKGERSRFDRDAGDNRRQGQRSHGRSQDRNEGGRSQRQGDDRYSNNRSGDNRNSHNTNSRNGNNSNRGANGNNAPRGRKPVSSGIKKWKSKKES